MAEEQKANGSSHDICLVDKLRLEINQTEIIPRKSTN
jgi:hypothetical protein